MGCGECGQPLDSEDRLLGLLAIIHGDGGHHAADVGVEVAWREAMKLSSARKAKAVEQGRELARIDTLIESNSSLPKKDMRDLGYGDTEARVRRWMQWRDEKVRWQRNELAKAQTRVNAAVNQLVGERERIPLDVLASSAQEKLVTMMELMLDQGLDMSPAGMIRRAKNLSRK